MMNAAAAPSMTTSGSHGSGMSGSHHSALSISSGNAPDGIIHGGSATPSKSSVAASASSDARPFLRSDSRSESRAYPAQARRSSDALARLQFLIRTNSKVVAAVVVFAFFVVFVLDDEGGSGGGGGSSGGGAGIRGSLTGHHAFDHWGGAFHPGYFSASSAIIDDHTFRFAAVTDLDELSKVADSKKPMFRSILVPGILSRDDATGRYSVQFESSRTLLSKHNEAGRGMELSELTLYNDRLLSFDDRTGDVFELLSSDDGQKTYVVPRFVITEGGGDTDKGMKWEWATVKGGELYIGSMGKEYTNSDGSVDNTNNLWIAVINDRGELKRVDWERQYNFVRAALGAASPGYIINEAILWSEHLKKWVFLPRRISVEMYDEDMDEKRGSNKLALVDDKFSKATVVEIDMKDKDPLHGFSSFAFVPGTRDEHAIATRSVEEDCQHTMETCKQRSYFVVFNVLTGEVLMDEVKIDIDMKFEGVEFIDINTKSEYTDQ